MKYSQFQKRKLGEILNFRRGHDLCKKDMIYGIYPVVGSNGVIGFHNKFTTDIPCLTIGRSGNIGTPHFLKQKCWAHNTTLYVDDFKGSYPEYVYYLLKTLDLAHYGGGSAVPTLNRNHIHPVDVIFTTNIKDQIKIAHILSIIDKKIEMNNIINENLQSISQLLFKHWFVDFEFENEEGLPYKSSGGQMVDSELGLIPNGWEVKKIESFAKINGGKRLPKEKNLITYKTNHPYIRITDVDNARIKLDKLMFLDDETFDSIRNYIIRKDNIFVSIVGTIGLVGTINSMLDYANLTENMAKITLDNESVIKKYYLLAFLSTKDAQHNLKSRNAGSTQPKLPLGRIRDFPIVVPHVDLMCMFNDLCEKNYEKIDEVEIENLSLTNLRDTLLPKLINGEIDLDNLEINI